MASIRKRGKKWQARIQRLGYPDIAKTFFIKSDAEKWARAIEREQDLGKYLPPTEDKKTTLKQLIDRYKIEVVPSFRGKHTELVRLDTISNALGKICIFALTPKFVAAYRDARLKQVSGSTTLRELQTLSAMLSHAKREWEYRVDNVVQSIRRPSCSHLAKPYQFEVEFSPRKEALHEEIEIQ